MASPDVQNRSESEASYRGLRQWASKAKDAIKSNPGKYEPPDLETLRMAVPGGVFRGAALVSEGDEFGRTLLALDTLSPEGEVVTRYMLPAHAASTRGLELAGANIIMIKGSNGTIKGSYFDLSKGQVRTNLHRALFGLRSTGRCWEKKNEDRHRYIVPSAYKVGQGFTREMLFAALRKDGNEQRIALLLELFAIADTWHWDELAAATGVTADRRFVL